MQLKKSLIVILFISSLTLTACNNGGSMSPTAPNAQAAPNAQTVLSLPKVGDYSVLGDQFTFRQPEGQCIFKLAPMVSYVAIAQEYKPYKWSDEISVQFVRIADYDNLGFTWKMSYKTDDGDEQIIKEGRVLKSMPADPNTNQHWFTHQFNKSGQLIIRYFDPNGNYIDGSLRDTWIKCFDADKSPSRIVQPSNIWTNGKGGSRDGYLDIQLNNHPDVKIISAKDPYARGRIINGNFRIDDYHFKLPYGYRGIDNYTETIQLQLEAYGIKQGLEYDLIVSNDPIRGPIVQSTTPVRWFSPTM